MPIRLFRSFPRTAASTGKPMKKRHMLVLAGVLTLAGACNNEQFLDVNTNPNAPQDVSANLYLAPMIHWMVTAEQYDGRFVGHYNQEWYSTSTSRPSTVNSSTARSNLRLPM